MKKIILITSMIVSQGIIVSGCDSEVPGPSRGAGKIVSSVQSGNGSARTSSSTNRGSSRNNPILADEDGGAGEGADGADVAPSIPSRNPVAPAPRGPVNAAPLGGAPLPAPEVILPPLPEDPVVGALPPAPMASNLRWLVMGDFGLESLASIPDCSAGTQQRSVCNQQNAKCRSSFQTTCSSASCRRLFKCVTGQTNSLIWFPMGDGTTTQQAASAGYGLCSMDSSVAGSACSTVNARCLSTFCTSGSGDNCGRRVFKCLTSGVEGQLFLRWMGDKSVAELAGIPTCSVSENIAGTSCTTEESRCVSSFFTDAPANTKRRLFKCTP